MKSKAYDELYAYTLMYQCCSKIKDAQAAVRALHIYNREFPQACEPFDAVDRLVQTVDRLEEDFNYTKRMWEASMIDEY